LKGQYYGGFFTQSDSTGDIHLFTTGLAKACERLGVNIVYGQDVVQLNSDGSVAQVLTKEGQESKLHQFDAILVCAGVASRAFASQLGDRVNIYPVKGYSITVNLLDEESQSAAPTVSLLDDETKLVTSRLGLDRFRVAGTAEFNGFNKDIRADRVKPLIDWVNTCFPGVSTRQVVPWAGLRPMMPNMMPRVGRGAKKNVFYNTGHGHLGWTLSAVTAEMVSQIIGESLPQSESTVIGAQAALAA
jgi:D-amino-acid dehydrogenase